MVSAPGLRNRNSNARPPTPPLLPVELATTEFPAAFSAKKSMSSVTPFWGSAQPRLRRTCAPAATVIWNSLSAPAPGRKSMQLVPLMAAGHAVVR